VEVMVGHQRAPTWTRCKEGNQRAQPLHDTVHSSVLSLQLTGGRAYSNGGKWGISTILLGSILSSTETHCGEKRFAMPRLDAQ
jgi:hypothetical protein